jgi:Flp pilus assembly protein TadD
MAGFLGWSRGLALGAVAAALVAQELPSIPDPPPLQAPTPAELLPLRPFQLDLGSGGSRVPFDWRGERVSEALGMLEKARTLRPYDGYIVDSVGWAYYRMGRYDDAAKTLEQAVLLVPGDPTINEHLGDALWRAGKRIDARFQWNHALAFGADAEAKAGIEQKLKAGLPS